MKRKKLHGIAILVLIISVLMSGCAASQTGSLSSGNDAGEYHATVEEVQSISDLYPDVDWNDGASSRDLWTKVADIETDSETGNKYRTIQYDFISNTAKIAGTIETEYEFRSGKWTYKSITERTESVEWNLEGVYEFVLDEVYCNVMIDSVDFENELAHIYWYGSYEDDFSGTYLEDFWMPIWNKTTPLGFKESEEPEEVVDFLYYDVSIAGDGDKKVPFGMLATKEDMYCGFKEKTSTRVPPSALAHIQQEVDVPQRVGGIKEGIGIPTQEEKHEEGNNGAQDAVNHNSADASHEKDSIWLDGTEFKILEYLDDENMLVKLRLSGYMIQAVVPRALGTDKYVCEYDYESYGGITETYIKLMRRDKANAIGFAYMQGEGAVASMEEEIASLYEQLDADEILEVQTLRNGNAFAYMDGDYVQLSEYDEEEWVPGYMMAILNPEEDMVFVMMILNDNTDEINPDYFEHVAFRKLEKSDHALKTENSPENYEQVMDDRYALYKEIIKEPATYLQENYNDIGANDLDYHYLYDFTSDNVPEMVFMGSPRRLAIVGDKNAISLFGSEVVFADEPNVFYSNVTWQEDVTWTRYEVGMDANGYLVANETTWLEANYDGWSYKEEPISQSEYDELVAEMYDVNRPQPKFYYSQEFYASKSGFYDSVKCLTDGYLFDKY